MTSECVPFEAQGIEFGSCAILNTLHVPFQVRQAFLTQYEQDETVIKMTTNLIFHGRFIGTIWREIR